MTIKQNTKLGQNIDAPEFVPKCGAQGVAKSQQQTRISNMTNGRSGPILKGTVEGVHVEFLADTGAESTILSQKCLASLPKEVRAKFQDSIGSVYAADGRRVPSKGPVLCQLEFGGRRILDAVYAADIQDTALLGWEA